MKAWWQHIQRGLSQQECEAIIRCGLESAPKEATVGHGGTCKVDPNIRVSKVAWISRWDYRLLSLFHKLDLMGRQANAYAFGLTLDTFYEMQFTVYDAAREEHYHWHTDNCWKPNPIGDRVFERKMSMVVQLSKPDDYDGGRLKLKNDPLPPEVFYNQGDVIFFPAFNEHCVTPVTRGTRYSLVSWFMGPKIQ